MNIPVYLRECFIIVMNSVDSELCLLTLSLFAEINRHFHCIYYHALVRTIVYFPTFWIIENVVSVWTKLFKLSIFKAFSVRCSLNFYMKLYIFNLYSWCKSVVCLHWFCLFNRVYVKTCLLYFIMYAIYLFIFFPVLSCILSLSECTSF